MFVTEIIPESNTVVLGEIDALVRNGMTVSQINLMKYGQLNNGQEAVTQVRYNDKGVMSSLHPEGNNVSVDFYANVKGIAPGQSAVFYEGDDVIGGGIISRSTLNTFT